MKQGSTRSAVAFVLAVCPKPLAAKVSGSRTGASSRSELISRPRPMIGSLNTNPDGFFKNFENSQEQIRTNLRMFLRLPDQVSGRKSFCQDTCVILLQVLLALIFFFCKKLALWMPRQ